MKVNYNKVYGNDGIIYNQVITITEEQFNILNDSIDAEIATGYPNIKNYAFGDNFRAEHYLHNLRWWYPKRLCFLNITQLRYIYRHLKTMDRTNRIKLDRNTVLKVLRGGE